MLIQHTTSAVNSVHIASNGGVTVPSASRSDPAHDTPPKVAEVGQPSAAQLKSAVNDLNQSMKANNSNLAFSIDQDTQQTVVKVLDSKTGETIKQFPSKEAIAIAKAIGDVQHGLLLKQKA